MWGSRAIPWWWHMLFITLWLVLTAWIVALMDQFSFFMVSGVWNNPWFPRHWWWHVIPPPPLTRGPPFIIILWLVCIDPWIFHYFIMDELFYIGVALCLAYFNNCWPSFEDRAIILFLLTYSSMSMGIILLFFPLNGWIDSIFYCLWVFLAELIHYFIVSWLFPSLFY